MLAYSATELAALAGVSKASTARFFKRLGFADFQAFRQHQRQGAPQPSPLYRMVQQGTQALARCNNTLRKTPGGCRPWPTA